MTVVPGGPEVGLKLTSAVGTWKKGLKIVSTPAAVKIEVSRAARPSGGGVAVFGLSGWRGRGAMPPPIATLWGGLWGFVANPPRVGVPPAPPPPHRRVTMSNPGVGEVAPGSHG